MALRTLYHRLVPEETRFWLYKQRHLNAFRQLRNQVNVHDRAVFSLRGFDERQCIFVHITKTAGTSVANSLFGALPYHYTAPQYRVIFGRRDFNRYFKFAFARNPWDRLYSAWSYLKGGGWDDQDRQWAAQYLAGHDDFNDFVIHWLSADRMSSHLHFQPQSHFLCDHRGRVLIDHLGYFETLQADFNAIRDRIHPGAELPHTNRSRRVDYREIYTPAAIDQVARLYAQDIALLGYQFDGHTRQRSHQGKLVPA